MTKDTATEMKNVFDRFISKLDAVKKEHLSLRVYE